MTDQNVARADRVPDGVDGRSEGAPEDGAALPTDVLAARTQSAHLHQLAGRTHEHGGALEAAIGLRTCRRRVAVSIAQRPLPVSV